MVRVSLFISVVKLCFEGKGFVGRTMSQVACLVMFQSRLAEAYLVGYLYVL